MTAILIANRGEIALRIIRSCHLMGYDAIAVFDHKDRDAAHCQAADRAYFLKGDALSETYLNGEALIALAVEVGAWAIHPGYGFLSEVAEFARRTQDAGLVWIGPDPETMALMADKGRARDFVSTLDIPVIPGYQGDDSSADLEREAKRIGYPVMLKAAQGGGGRGIRRLDDSSQLPEAVASSRREAQLAFGQDGLILEKYLYPARHIEVQILADGDKTLCLGDRDCSLQRRHQKLIEEGPAWHLSQKTRAELWQYARRIGEACRYKGAGTVEFMVVDDEASGDSQIYFMEMNTRIQVEHPVTEVLSGIDLVAEQIRIAAGHDLSCSVDGEPAAGHAIEVRLVSEDPSRGFRPQSGSLHVVEFADHPGLRVDHALSTGVTLRTDVDSMMAKLIAYGADRQQARLRLIRALDQLHVGGVVHNGSYLKAIATSTWFAKGHYHTKTIDEEPSELAPADARTVVKLAALAREYSYWQNANQLTGLRPSMGYRSPFWLSWNEVVVQGQLTLVHRHPLTFAVSFDDDSTSETVEIRAVAGRSQRFRVDSSEVGFCLVEGQILLTFSGGSFTIEDLAEAPRSVEGARVGDQSGLLVAPIDGAVTKVLKAQAAQVRAGETLVVLEAMKMEHEVKAPFAGLIQDVRVRVGDQVKWNQLMLEVRQR